MTKYGMFILLCCLTLLSSMQTSATTLSIKMEPLPNVDIRLGGKNSVFDKPLGVGPGSVNENLKKASEDIWNTLNKMNEDLLKTTQNMNRELKVAESNISRELTKLREDLTPDSLQVDLDNKFNIIKSHSHNKLSNVFSGQFQLAALLNQDNLKRLVEQYGDEEIIKQIYANISRESNKAALNINGVYKQARIDLDRELTKAKENIDRDLTDMKNDADETLTIAKQDFSRELDEAIINTKTEYHYFFGTICGTTSERKALQRKYDQREISKSDYKRQREEIGDGPSCFLGISISEDENGEPKMLLIDKDGQVAQVPDKQKAETEGDLVAFYRYAKIQEYIDDNNINSIDAYYVETDQTGEDGNSMFIAIADISSLSRAPAGGTLVLDPARLLKHAPPNLRVVGPPNLVTIIIDGVKFVADYRNSIENKIKFDADHQKLQASLSPGEKLDMYMVTIDGQYSGLIRRSDSNLLPGKSRFQRVQIFSKIELPSQPKELLNQNLDQEYVNFVMKELNEKKKNKLIDEYYEKRKEAKE